MRRSSKHPARLGVQGGRLLDVGCGTGQALRAFNGLFEAHGVEPSPFAVGVARQFAASVHMGDLMSAKFPSGHFDVVTAFDVLEHLADPLSALREIFRIVRPGGVLVAETGNIESLNARFAGKRWYDVRLPGHLSFFSPRTLGVALEGAGFDVKVAERTASMTPRCGFSPGMREDPCAPSSRSDSGSQALIRPFFRSPDADYSVRYLFDHMIVAASPQSRELSSGEQIQGRR